MRPHQIDDQELLEALTGTFRLKGYEGASLKDLSEATGLKKASLYHRFPKGKQEMAESVLKHMEAWVAQHVLQALQQPDTPAEIRLTEALSHIRTLYNNGQDNCIFKAFSMQEGSDLFQTLISSGLKDWLDGFTAFGQSAGFPPATARDMALSSLIAIQGSLILSKGLNDTVIFENTLKDIYIKYLKQ